MDDNINNMSDEELNEYVGKYWKEVQDILDSRDNADYVVNEQQLAKMVYTHEFFKNYAKKNGGKITELIMEPKQETCGMTVSFTLFYLHTVELQKFAHILSWFSAISIDATLDGEVCISFNIPNVFRKKDSK